MRRPSVAVALTTAFATCAVYLAALLVTEPGGPAGSLVDVWLYNALIVAAAVDRNGASLVIAADRLAWSLIALALWCTVFGELYTAVLEPEGYPSLADAAWLSFYPLLYVGIVLLVRRRARFVAGTLWLDGLMASVTAAALGSALLVEAVVRTNEGSRSAIATNLAYPLGDVLLLSAVFGVLSLGGWRLGRRWLLLAGGLLATAVADAVYLFQVDTYQEGGALDVLWPLSSLLIATAAWVSARHERALDVDGRPLLAVPIVCALGAIGDLRRRPLHPRQRPGTDPRDRGARARRRPARADLPRERPALRPDPSRVDHGLAHGARQPSQAPDRPPGRARPSTRHRPRS